MALAAPSFRKKKQKISFFVLFFAHLFVSLPRRKLAHSWAAGGHDDSERRFRTYVVEHYLKKKNMANVATVPTEGQLIVSVENVSMLKDLKKAISMMRGVTKITIPRRRLTSYERSLRDLDEGRVFKYDSLEDLIKEIEG